MEGVGLYEVPTAFVKLYIQTPRYYAAVVENTVDHASLIVTTLIQGTREICRVCIQYEARKPAKRTRQNPNRCMLNQISTEDIALP